MGQVSEGVSGPLIVVVNTSKAITNLFARADIELCHQPPYSPDFNPIEMMWATVKSSLRSAKARGFEQQICAIADALADLTP